MNTEKLKIICVEFENLNNFDNGKFKIDFFATDRVFDKSELCKISGNISAQNIICFVGLNATGKTTALRLLKIALNIIVFNTPLNVLSITNMINDGTIIRTSFFYDGFYYQLESILGINADNKINPFYYREEILKSKNFNTVKSKKDLLDFQNSHNVKIQKRTTLNPEIKIYLDDDKSFINPIIKSNGSYVFDNLGLNYINVATTLGKTPSDILEIFDESIESLFIKSMPDKSAEWELKFKDDNLIYKESNPIALNLIVSTGTIRGQGLIQNAIEALKKGGYLIIDELEMHLNKELVKVILGLFKSKQTNPYGACLIFSTHYPEILDTLDRKDNIYIMRKNNHLLSASKLSDEFKRNDFKKSEIILSNVLSGTVPKYESIQKLRDYICRQL